MQSGDGFSTQITLQHLTPGVKPFLGVDQYHLDLRRCISEGEHPKDQKVPTATERV